MRKIIVPFVALFVVAGMVNFTIPAPTLAVAEGQGGDNLTRVLIAFDKPIGPSEQALVRAHGGKIKYSYSIVDAIAATIPAGAIEGLSHNPHVTAVELDDTVYATDIELDNSWGVKRIGAGTVHTSSPINKGAGVKIGIIDSGINYNHPDLNANYRGGYDFYYYDNEPLDVYGHGTHIAGTACAEDNDNGTKDKKGLPVYGVVGVAPKCDLYSLRVLSDSGVGYWSDIIAAVDWSTGGLIYLPGYWDEPVGAPEEKIQGVKMDVINLSLGKEAYPGDVVRDAFANAEAQGIVIVAAAGNSGNAAGSGDNVIYPARFDSVIAVGATDSADKRASFSSTGPKVELAAPGVSVYSTWNDNTSYSAPQPKCNRSDGGCYKYGSGTSMASPHVAGVAALVIATGVLDTNDNGRINDEVRGIMNSTAQELGTAGPDNQYGNGLVSAVAAVAQSQVLWP
jgi:subtilisin